MQKIKKVLYSVLTVIVIMSLGFAPSGEKAFALNWGNMGMQMMEAGIIDGEKFENLYQSRGRFSNEDKKLLYGKNQKITINETNSHMMLNLLWAFGLANKNPILENGPMMTYSGAGSPAEALAKAGNFASTGGWTLARGDAMDHYSMHQFLVLTEAEQALVEKTAKNIYRPCCDNSTYFPDCNHGMAMLGLLELMASEGASEADIYKTAEEINNLWFPKVVKTGCDI